MNGAEGESRSTPATRRRRQRQEAADTVGLVRTIGKRERIKVRNQCASLGLRHRAAGLEISDAVGLAPVAAGAQTLDEFDQRLLALVAHNAIEFGKVREDFVVAEARIMSTDREVGLHT